jgi:hypothetical protein
VGTGHSFGLSLTSRLRKCPLLHSHILGEIICRLLSLSKRQSARLVIATRKDLDSAVARRQARPRRCGSPSSYGETVAQPLHVLVKMMWSASQKAAKTGQCSAAIAVSSGLGCSLFTSHSRFDAAPYQTSAAADRHLRSEDERKPPGLTVAGHGDFAHIRRRASSALQEQR